MVKLNTIHGDFHEEYKREESNIVRKREEKKIKKNDVG